MRYVFSCLAAAGALCLTACAGPGAPALPLTPPASLSGPLAQGQAAWPQGAWWRAFADPQLDALIERALADAPSMQLARARLRQAVAVGEQAGAALLPGAAFCKWWQKLQPLAIFAVFQQETSGDRKI